MCAFRATQPLCISNGYEVWRCRACCSDFVWPQPDSSELKAYYDQTSYFQGDQFGSYSNYDLDTEAVLPLYRELLQEISGGTRRSILDIGCAYGTHLAIAAEQGWDAYGVELSNHARQVALQRHGDKIAVFQSVEEVPSHEFDFITLFDVIEHLTHPYEIFDALFRRGLIGEHTVVALTTPNARSSHAVSDPAGWPYRYPPAHLIYYSSQSLKILWAQIGVRNIEVKGIYPVDQYESAVFPDEDSQLNWRAQKFAGLLCIAKGFEISLQFLVHQLEIAINQTCNSSTGQQDVVNVLALSFAESTQNVKIQKIATLLQRLHVLARESSRVGLEHDMAMDNAKFQGMQDLLVAESEKLHLEIHQLRQTKWFRLRDTLGTRPIKLRSILKVAYLVAVMVTPPPVRKVFRSFLQWTNNIVASGVSQVEPYVVRERSLTLLPRPHIVHVIANFMTGGSSRLVVDLIERLGEHYEQSVITSFVPNPPAYIGLQITEFRDHHNEYSFVKYLLRMKPALIHVHYWGDVDESWYATAISAAETIGIPMIENINTPVKPYFSKFVKRYVYVSDYVRKVFGRSDPEHVTIYPGSDFSYFSHESREEEVTDCVGMVYRLERDKLGEDAVLPFIIVAKERPQTRILIVGGGELLSVFKKAVAYAGVTNNFEFAGSISYADLPNMYRRMTLYAAPVCKESFGQAAVFAMNMGIPVCGYDVDAISEVVADRSLLAPGGDAVGLASIIIRLLNSEEERARVGEQQHLRAQAHFSVEAMIQAYSNVYRELTGLPS